MEKLLLKYTETLLVVSSLTDYCPSLWPYFFSALPKVENNQKTNKQTNKSNQTKTKKNKTKKQQFHVPDKVLCDSAHSNETGLGKENL